MLFHFKVNELRYRLCAVTPNFFKGQNLLKKILRKDNIGQIEKSFLIDLLTPNNAIYRG